jgi:hypothetical protein
MNLAALAAGLTTDALRSALKKGSSEGAEADPLRGLLWASALVTCLYVLLGWTSFTPPEGKKIIDVHDNPDGIDIPPGGEEEVSGFPKCLQEAKETFRDPVFWRMVGLSGAIFGARTIFRHMDGTLPKWAEREIGPDVHYGMIYAINPLIIIFAVPIVQAKLVSVDPYRCLVWGTGLTALAPFILTFLPASYAAAILFMLLFSAGEAIYSPRLTEYAMVLAPPGREGTYSTLAAAPMFLVKIAVGTLGGELLGLYCPSRKPSDHGDVGRHCQLMWAFIGLTALTTPVILIWARKWLYSDAVRERLRS